MTKKLVKQEWDVGIEQGSINPFVNVISDTDVLDENYGSSGWGYHTAIWKKGEVPEDQIEDNAQIFVMPWDEYEEVTDLTDEEATALEEILKKDGYSIGVIEDNLDDPRLGRIKDKLQAML